MAPDTCLRVLRETATGGGLDVELVTVFSGLLPVLEPQLPREPVRSLDGLHPFEMMPQDGA